ncbi:MAG: hypothetical protein K9G46_07080 [Flavobacteriales bacterium]|nr:hypothetical protein [Flavobacteriales bacterium]
MALVIDQMRNQLTNKKAGLYRGNIGSNLTPIVRPGDKPATIDLTSQKPSDLTIVMDNTSGKEWYDAAGVWFMIGGALPDHLEAFPDEVAGVWTEANFGFTNDKLIRYQLLGMGLKFNRVDRVVTSDVDQYNQSIKAYRGTYNDVVPKELSQDMNNKSSQDYNPLINNVPIMDGSLDFIFYNTYFFFVLGGQKLTQTFRVSEGINWPFLAHH